MYKSRVVASCFLTDVFLGAIHNTQQYLAFFTSVQQRVFKQFLFLCSPVFFLIPGVTLGVVEEAGRLGVRNLWLQPGSENDEVSVIGFGAEHP